MNKIVSCIKRIVLAFTYIYGFNIMLCNLNMNIAVNYFSVGTVSLLGIPGMISLVVLKAIIK